MSCEAYRERVLEAVDGHVDRALEEHLETCTGCRLLLADLRRIRHASERLDRHALGPNSWSTLAARLEAEGAFASPRRGSLGTGWRWLAAAAGLTFVVGLSLVGLNRSLGTGPAAPAQVESTASPDSLVSEIEKELELASTHYDNALARLEKVAEASESGIDPAVTATLRQNLEVIDSAIDESRRALRAQPNNQLAQQSLLEAFRRKVSLLQDTIALMNEMRKGNQAEAARILEGLNKSSGVLDDDGPWRRLS